MGCDYYIYTGLRIKYYNTNTNDIDSAYVELSKDEHWFDDNEDFMSYEQEMESAVHADVILYENDSWKSTRAKSKYEWMVIDKIKNRKIIEVVKCEAYERRG